MTQRTEAEIRAKIDLYKVKWDRGGFEPMYFFDGYVSALEWVLSGSPSPVAGDDEIAELRATMQR